MPQGRKVPQTFSPQGLYKGENIGKAINDAMKAIEAENEDLRGVLLKTFSQIPMDIEGDIFGKIYEYFLGKFAMSKGQKGGGQSSLQCRWSGQGKDQG